MTAAEPDAGLRLCVVIPVKDDERVLDLCQALLAQRASRSCEIVVSCNASPQHLIDRLRRVGGESLATLCRVRLVEQPLAGAAAALNCAIRTARASHVLILDSDCMPAAGLLQAYVSRLPDASLLRGPVAFRGATPFARLTAAYRECFYAAVETRGLAYTPNVLMSRELFESCGGFDEALRHAYDSELGDRLASQGRTAALCPDAGVVHDCHTSLSAELSVWFHYGVGRRRRFARQLRQRGLAAIWAMIFGDIAWRFLDGTPQRLAYVTAYWSVRTLGVCVG